MNWEFHAVTHTDSKELIETYRWLAIDAITEWIEDVELELVETKEPQPEGGFEEFPPGFFHVGPSYCFRFRVYGPGGCMNPPEYDVTVKQTFYPVFDKELYEETMKRRMRFRTISKATPIE